MSRIDAAEALVAGYNHAGRRLTLRELRRRRGLSIRAVEAETGYNRASLSKIERGIELPNPAIMLALSDLYGVPPEEWQVVVEYQIAEEWAA
jgi:transcriptional regulator with XRE-family HTH domain